MYGVGEEPDPRFSLANERTTLAWLRTAMGLVAGAVALLSVTAALPKLPAWAPLVAAVAAIGGGMLAIRATARWASIERAMRLRRPLPPPRALTFLASGVGLLAATVLVIVVIELMA